MTSLHGVALVTGAGAGLGRACALTLGQRGARVAVHYMKSRDGAEEVVAALKAAGTEAQAFQGGPDEVRRRDVARRGGDRALRRDRHPGQQRRRPDRAHAAPGDERRALPRGDGREPHQRVLHVPRRRPPGWSRASSGAIVNMSSLAAWNGGGPGAGAYAAAKGAVVSLTKALAKELAPHGIRVNCVAPGLIGETAFHGRFTAPPAFENAAKSVLLGRAGTPDEVATVVAFLASSDSAFLTGETIEINGGMNMR